MYHLSGARADEASALDDEPPAKLLDDLFRKTKTTPCIYWLALTAEQQKERNEVKARSDEIRRQRIAEREKAEAEQIEKRRKVWHM